MTATPAIMLIVSLVVEFILIGFLVKELKKGIKP